MTLTAHESGNQIYTYEQLSSLDLTRTPKHIAFIPDGNRRWAKLHGMNPTEGHQKGADILMDIVKGCKELGVRTATFFIFSTENWNRPFTEVQGLMWLLKKYLIQQRQTLIENGVRLCSIGEIGGLPKRVQTALSETIDATAHCNEIDVVFALNYGARDEIRRAVCRLADDIANKKINKEQVSEKLISRYLDTAQWQDPDLIIRTSGEMRLSNFLLWQSTYAEIYPFSVYWPDFTPEHLYQATSEYQKRERRHGA